MSEWEIERDKYILCIARFVKHKSIHYLVKAFKNLKLGSKGWKLVIVGELPYPNKYSEYLKKLAKEDKDIIFTGYQLSQDLDQLFASAYVYVRSSESEGLSMSILEAMSHGKGVLVSDIPENLEAISGFGFYFKNKDIENL